MRDLAAEYGHLTDKFALEYSDWYEAILPIRRAAILEIGIAWGGSLLMWRGMCPDAKIVGVDICPPADPPLGIIQIRGDQRDDDLADKVRAYSPDGYDLIVDDASHYGSASTLTFNHLWPLVKPGGWYALEDWPVGLPGNPYYPGYEGDSMVRLVQSFVELIKPPVDLTDMGEYTIEAGGPGAVTEVRIKYGLALIRKSGRTE